MRRVLPFALCLLAGCAARHSGMDRRPVASTAIDGQPRTEEDLWQSLRRNRPSAPQETGQDAEFLHTPKIGAVSLTCQLPLEVATDRAWALTDEKALPPDLRALWHANGLRLGVLRAADWEKFRLALNRREKNAKTQPGVLAQDRATFVIRPFPAPLHLGGPLPHGLRLPLDRTLPPLAPVTEWLRTFEGDRAQLLVSGRFADQQLTELTLTPHLLRPTPVVLIDPDAGPPKAWEKAVQGQAVDWLAAPVQPRPGELIVVGLYWPWKITPPPKAKDTDPDKDRSGAPRKEDDPKGKADKAEADDDLLLAATPPPLPTTFGRALFTAIQSSGEFQTLVVFEAQ